MSAAPITATSTADRLQAALSDAHAAVDRLLSATDGQREDDKQGAGGSMRQQLTEVERLARRVDAVRLRVLARAERERLADRTGHTDTGSWAAGATNGDRRPAARDVMLAAALDAPGEALVDLSGDGGQSSDASCPGTSSGTDDGTETSSGTEDCSPSGPEPSAAGDRTGESPGRRRMQATRAALSAGDISAEHARVIARALDDLPDRVGELGRRRCEQRMLSLAARLSPSRLRGAGRRILAEVEPDPQAADAHEDALVSREEDRAHERAELWIKDNHDGTMTGHFTVPRASGMVLRKVIDAMTAPRRRDGRDGDEPAPASARGAGMGVGGERSGADRKAAGLDWQHRRGLALADLLLRLPTDHLHAKVAATLLVTTRLEDLQGELTKVGATDMAEPVGAGTVRRMACGAGIVPAVLDGESVPLDLGRQRRLFSDAQRVALASRYTECAAEGCDRPFAWTEIHHLSAWRAGGPTDLDNAVPLCGRHHRMIDGPDWQHSLRRGADGATTIRFHRRT